MVQALGGLMSITGDPDGSPTKVGVALVDILTAKDATIGILAALTARRETGLGVHLEVNLLSSLQGALANQGQAYLGAAVMPVRMGNAHPSIAPYELLNCADGPLAVACGNDSQFRSILGVLALDEFTTDARFMTNRARVENRQDLIAMLELRMLTDDASVWQDAFTSVGVPAGRVGTIADGIELAESLGLAPTIPVQTSVGETVGTQFRSPITWSPPFEPRTAAPPALGEHGDAIREWLHSSSEPITRTAER